MLLIEDEGECLCIDKVQTRGIQCTSRIGKERPSMPGFQGVVGIPSGTKNKEIIKRTTKTIAQ